MARSEYNQAHTHTHLHLFCGEERGQSKINHTEVKICSGSLVCGIMERGNVRVK